MFDYISRNGYASVSELMSTFGISSSTLKRDLDYMAEMKMAARVYGGMVINSTASVAPHNNNSEATLKLARCAAELIEDGDVILLLSGETCFSLYKEIRAKNVTVFTSNILTAFYLNENVSHLYLLEGEISFHHYRKQEVSLYHSQLGGDLTLLNMERISPSKIFFSVSAISEKLDLQCQTGGETAIIQKIIKMDAMKILIADQTKYAERRTFNATPMESVNVFITEAQIDPSKKAALEAKDIRVIFV
jgi:DeoR family transcriptional regulator of aga operon